MKGGTATQVISCTISGWFIGKPNISLSFDSAIDPEVINSNLLEFYTDESKITLFTSISPKKSGWITCSVSEKEKNDYVAKHFLLVEGTLVISTRLLEVVFKLYWQWYLHKYNYIRSAIYKFRWADSM